MILTLLVLSLQEIPLQEWPKEPAPVCIEYCNDHNTRTY